LVYAEYCSKSTAQDYARAQFKRLKIADVDTASERSDWEFIRRIGIYGSDLVASYVVDVAAKNGKLAILAYLAEHRNCDLVGKRAHGWFQNTPKSCVDSAAEGEDWDVLKYIALYGSTDVAKYVLDKAAEKMRWFLVGYVADFAINQAVRDYAKSRFGLLTNSDVDMAINTRDWPVIEYMYRFGPEEIVEYEIKKAKESLDAAINEGDWGFVSLICTVIYSPDIVRYAIDAAAVKNKQNVIKFICLHSGSSGETAKYAIDALAANSGWSAIKEIARLTSKYKHTHITSYARKKLEEAERRKPNEKKW